MHNSLLIERVFAPLNQFGQYLCSGCKKEHYVKTSVRTPHVVSSSTLNGWRGSLDDPNYPGDWVHVEWDTVSGAVIRNNIHSLFAQWGRSHRPLHVFCVSGINNVMVGHSVDFIMSEYQALKDIVLSICPDDPTRL